MKCALCPTKSEVLHEVISPAIRLCSNCRTKLETHICVVCVGCSTAFWLKKTPGNVMQASQMSDLPPAHIMDNYLIHEIKTCKRCYEAVKDFTVSRAWVQ
jgi:hypothetical protein